MTNRILIRIRQCPDTPTIIFKTWSTSLLLGICLQITSELDTRPGFDDVVNEDTTIEYFSFLEGV